MLLLCIGLFFTACIPASTPQVVKIGLIAPFEGLYRRTGYAALAEMRKVLAAHAPASTAYRILPVALDDGGDPEQARRAAQKLLVDPEVQVVVGPLFPHTIAAVREVMQQQTKVRWLPLDQLWPNQYENELIAAVAQYATAQGAGQLVVAGWTPDAATQESTLWTSSIDIPVQFSDDPAVAPPDAAVLWMGEPAGAASFLNRLRPEQPQVPFWMGNSGGDPVFAERAQSLDNVYWAIWTDDGFASWHQGEPAAPPFAYLIYRATQMALAGVESQESPANITYSDVDDSVPQFQLYQISTNGVSSPTDASSLPH